MKLSEVASFIKSANAGATQLTFDIGFPDAATYERVTKGGFLGAAVVAGLYGLPAESIQVYEYVPALTVKVTIPRPSMSGGIDERDFDGVQQFAPLLDIEVDMEQPAGAAAPGKN